MKRANIKGIFLIVMFVLISISGNGQDKTNTPAAYEQMKYKNQWLSSSNSAGLLLDKPIDYTGINTSYTLYNGGFHRPQEGERGNDLNFDAEGAVFVGKIYAWGKFNYTRKTIEDANFNASIIDPFRGMPYMVADTNRSEWRNQVYDMSLKVVAPILSDKWHLGLEAGYKAVSGAKQRDPRSENYYYMVQVKPGIVYSINNRHHIGANFDYFNIKEESGMSKVNTYVDQQYYEMYGLGTSVQGVGTGRTTNYTGNGIGGGVQYNYQGAVNVLFSAGYAYKVEDVEIGFSDAADDSGVKDKKRNTKLQIFTNPKKLTHFLTLAYDDWRIDGIECITQYDNTAGQNGYVTLLRDVRSKYKTQTGTLDYDVSLNREEEYDWKAGLGVMYINKDDIYLSPRSKKTSENIAFQIRLKKNLVLSRSLLKRRILLSADYSYNNNLSGKYDYNGSHPEYIVVTKFEQTDSDYLNSNFWSVGGTVIYSQKIKETLLANLFAKAGFRYTKALGSEFGSRHHLQMSIGCNF